MKFTIEATSEEFANFLSAFISNSHKSYQAAEERIGNIVLTGLAKLNHPEKDTIDKEVPNGGYFH